MNCILGRALKSFDLSLATPCVRCLILCIAFNPFISTNSNSPRQTLKSIKGKHKENSMECFKLFREHLAAVGIIEPKSSLSARRFHFKNSTITLISFLSGVQMSKTLEDAHTLEEYAEIVYRMVYMYMATVLYANIVWKTPELFRFVNSLEDSITKRKWHVQKLHV